MLKKFKASSVLYRAALLAAIFVIGIVVGKIITISYFKVEENINLVDIISIAATLFAAWYVAKVLDKEKVDSRTEKDLILRRTEDIYQLIEDSHQKVTTGKIAYQEASSHLKRTNISINSIYRILEKIPLHTDQELKTNLLANTRKLRDLLTNTPIINDKQIQDSNLPIEVINGIVHLNKNRIAEIETEYDKLKDNILLMQLSINKC